MKRKLLALILFGLAFGFVEAAVVYYLRTLFGIGANFAQPANYTVIVNLGVIAFLSPGSIVLPNVAVTHAEAFRELATLIMLAVVGYLAGGRWRSRFAAFLVSFSAWDLFYYVFLRLLTGWPKTVFDIDVFFIDPVPWVGPVITAVAASLILLILGSVIFLRNARSEM